MDFKWNIMERYYGVIKIVNCKHKTAKYNDYVGCIDLLKLSARSG